MTPKISVIVPVYNVEKYVGTCIQSILYQTFKDFELIVVNDASIDNSLEVVKQFNDPRIKIIENEKNLGLSGARNVGLEKAIGEYIYFMDSDDAILPNALELLFNNINQSGYDVVHNTANFQALDNEFQLHGGGGGGMSIQFNYPCIR